MTNTEHGNEPTTAQPLGDDGGAEGASTGWRTADLLASIDGAAETEDPADTVGPTGASEAHDASDPDVRGRHGPVGVALGHDVAPEAVALQWSPPAPGPVRSAIGGPTVPSPPTPAAVPVDPDEQKRRDRRTTRLSVLVLGVGTFILLLLMRLDLIIKTTTPTGGDNAAHLVTAWFARRSLLPQGRLYGWTNDSFAGMPVLTFYFPLPIWLVVLVSVVLPFTVAFKVTTVAGILTLPFATFRLARRGGLAGWAPLYFAAGAFPYLALRHYRILGGNILSTMAGEFSFSIGLTLAVLYMGSLLTLLRTGKGKVSTAALLAVLPLCHIVTTLFAVIFTVAAVLTQTRRDRWRSQSSGLAWVIGIGLLISAFWTVPFGLGLPYTNSMDYERNTRVLRTLFPLLPKSSTLHTPADGVAQASIFCVLAVITVVLGIRRRHRFVITMSVAMALTAVVFALWPRSAMWNNRFLPFWFYGIYTLGAVSIYEILVWLAGLGQRTPTVSQPAGDDENAFAAPGDVAVMPAGTIAPADGAIAAAPPSGVDASDATGFTSFKDIVAATSGPASSGRLTASGRRSSAQGSSVIGLLGALLIILAVIVPALAFNSAHLPFSWAGGNFAGKEERAQWPEYHRLLTTVSALPCGRLFPEPSKEYQKYGSALSMMTLPYWTNSCIRSVDGVYFEASQTTPFHYLTAAQMAQNGAHPQRRLPYGSFDVAAGIAHLRSLGVRYILAVSPSMKSTLRQRSDMRFVVTSGPFDIFEIVDNAIVLPLDTEPVVVTGLDLSDSERFPDLGMAQWMRPASFPKTLALDGPPDWARVPVRYAAAAADAKPKRGDGISVGTAPTRSVMPVEVTGTVLGDHSVRFHVDRVGTPVLVRVSWFPNWKAKGAQGPYRVAPNFMVVIPTSNDVTLSYEYRKVELASFGLSALGIAALVHAALGVARTRRNRARLEKIKSSAAAATR